MIEITKGERHRPQAHNQSHRGSSVLVYDINTLPTSNEIVAKPVYI